MATAAAMTLAVHRYNPATSPVFDMPEFPSLRRVKPLPKRQRVAGDENTPPLPLASVSPSELAQRLKNAGGPEGILASVASTLESLQLPLSLPLPMPGPDATPEDLLAHADLLTSHMATQGYYLPILGGVQELFRGVAAAAAEGNGDNVDSAFASSAFALGLAGALAGSNGTEGLGSGERDDDDGRGDGDYMDHLQQPGNTKKRKVPANASSGHGHGHAGLEGRDGQDVEEEDSVAALEGRERPGPGQAGHEDSGLGEDEGTGHGVSTLMPRKGRMSAVTRAGLRHKETLKARKRQLATVLGALSHGDTLALDQALSVNYPFAAAAAASLSPPGSDGTFGDLKTSDVLKVRLSKRGAPRKARLTRATAKLRHPDKIGLAISDFTFSCPSETADRLIATKEEVSSLRARFETELVRQAAKAAKLVNASSIAVSTAVKRSGKKRGTGGVGGTQQPRIEATTPDSSSDLLAELGTSKPRGKKKKRSALANASNPHHLRNYVPSRLPHSGGTNQTQPAQSILGPLPLGFLSADIPPRRRRKGRTPVQPTTQLTNPAEEWICAFCEYELFYGDNQDYRRAVRNRRKILRRRRRAQERAAAAANGNSTVKASEKTRDEDEADEGYDEGYDGDEGFEPSTLAKQAKWKGEHHKDRERYG